jgi:Fe-S cluster assembly iron-binding protein IscA
MKLLKIRKKDSEQENKSLPIPLLAKDEIGITLEAKEKILKVLTENNLIDGYLRIALFGGGCSGLTLQFSLTNKVNENDKIFSFDEAKICIDNKEAQASM